jgi:CBS domain containing-hemolysin-like protein
LIEHTAAMLSRALGVRHSAVTKAHSAEEIRYVVGAAHAAGQLSEFERDALDNLLELRELSVREVMVPRDALTMVASDSTLEEVLRVFTASRHSRLPVYDGTREKVLGIVHVKDSVAYARAQITATARQRKLPRFDLRRLVRPMPFVPETKPLDQHLDELRSEHAIVSFVVDEYGTVTGMISADDALEQVFGRIRDEFDPRVKAVEPGASFEVEGIIPLRDLEIDYGIEVPAEPEYETLAGFLLFQLRRIPKPGDAVEYGGRRYEVLAMEGNRIAEVRIEPPRGETEKNVAN